MVNIKELACLEEPDVDGIILKWVLKKSNGCGLNSAELGKGLLSERLCTPLCSIKYREFLDKPII
jgi:hypothetical protein